jgi:hypothetical protein
VVALALVFWFGGAGCLAVSYARTASARETATPGNEHDCCKARRKPSGKMRKSPLAHRSDQLDFKLGFPALPGPARAISCCPLTAGSMVTSARSQTGDQLSLSQPTSFSGASANWNHAPPRVPLRLPNQAQSYLLDCVFLI